MSERREFVKVERLGNMARYSVTVPIEVEPIHDRIDALERRIESLEKRCGKIAAFSYGDNDRRIKDHERRIERIERKLNHKGGTE